ncbi:MAG: M1 family metallopeptidase [Balneolaceae bacterium]|nr:M1 family metallopeptidase [Balneolaceae bacterium]
MYKFRNILLTALLLSLWISVLPADAQLLQEQSEFSRADSLRGSITPERAWWDVTFYDLSVNIFPEDSTISGYNHITYRVTDSPQKMQIDLQQPLEIDRIRQGDENLEFNREGNAFFVDMPGNLKQDSLYTISVYYRGKPKVAENAPWDGGFVWATDSLGHPWIATANQGLGASVWWPNKDHQSDEPDSMDISITVPKPLVNVSNGRLKNKMEHEERTTYTWHVSNPINNYNVAVNAGNYVNFTDTYNGKNGKLDLSYWVLEQDLQKAQEQFKQVKPMMRCFEEWFGPYPFYEDSFKLVQTPHLGMEHQSAVAYGNAFQNGYRGSDLSGTGWGLKWDFIIIHEAAHEWWGNNITTKDIADMWVHEGFTSYAENIYVECRFGKEAGAEYARGLRDRIKNERPVTGTYGLNDEGSGDMYYKGNNMLHTIRQIVNNDSTWKSILRGLQQTFRHQTVTATQVERFIIEQSGKDLDDVFDQYLHYSEIPVFQYFFKNGRIYYRWKADVSHFDMPLELRNGLGQYVFIYPTSTRWKSSDLKLDAPSDIQINPNFYIRTEQVGTGLEQDS